MYLEWMGKNRAFVEKFIRYANTYAAVYKKEALYGTDIPISFEQVQVLEYLLENEQLNQNMSMIASRLGITPSNFTRIVNKLSGKKLLEKYYVEGNRKNIVIRVTDFGKEQYSSYSKWIYENSFSKLFVHMEKVPEEILWELAQGFEEALWLQEKTSTESKLIPVDETKKKGQYKKCTGSRKCTLFCCNFFYSVVEYLTRRLLQVAIK